MLRLAALFVPVFILNLGFAETCQERLFDANWPEDRHEKILKCKLVEITHGDKEVHYGNRICFGIKKTQYSDYLNTNYTVLRYEKGEYGSLRDIIAVRANGDVPDSYASFKRKYNKITVSYKHYSFSNGQAWKTETVVDLNKLTLVFNSYDKGVVFYSKELSVDYQCEVEL